MKNFELVPKSLVFSTVLKTSIVLKCLYKFSGEDGVFGFNIYECDSKYLYYFITSYNKSFVYRVRRCYFNNHSFFYISYILERDLFKRGLIPLRYKSL